MGSRGFQRGFSLLCQLHKPSVVALCEPRISGQAVDYFIKNTHFDCSFCVEAQGYSGGIWLLWKQEVDLKVLQCHNQYIHTEVCIDKTRVWITFVYASPSFSIRKELWAELEMLARRCNKPWLVGGDFMRCYDCLRGKVGEPEYLASANFSMVGCLKQA